MKIYVEIRDLFFYVPNKCDHRFFKNLKSGRRSSATY